MACWECTIMRTLVFLKNVKSSVLEININTCFGNDFKQAVSTASSEWNHWAVNLPTATEEASSSHQGMVGNSHTIRRIYSFAQGHSFTESRSLWPWHKYIWRISPRKQFLMSMAHKHSAVYKTLHVFKSLHADCQLFLKSRERWLD